ncbi:glycosyltransferase family 2 protein [Asticcacaulis sp. SL142]|uniref:glycosyltransferase family 2 protein n=1 Tax=Asticcacaulis sp. SL142 TaxID=2995155 RepID=UPI00226C8B08|nr:glycosyltransferase family 2 protein [Asticcacaulis sp. SL142]WAC46996.1 glycosyltransferase family 2 protein [Asticcacaulis sp. SL142]
MISVIIPYFQKETGILTRALDNIAAQTVQPFDIIIIDDSSPLSPDNEVAIRAEAERARIRIIRQPNGGPGAARNRGLMNLSLDTKYVAYLDSDDEWEPHHLERATAALRGGFDFYLCDYSWPGRSSTRFTQCRMFENRAPLNGHADFYDLSRDFFEVIFSQYPAHISASVLRVSSLGHLRFDTRLRRSSEDQMYFLAIAQAGARVVFDNHMGMCLNNGYNLYRNHKSGSIQFSEALLGNLYYHRLLGSGAVQMPEPLKVRNRNHIRGNAIGFAKSEIKYALKSGRTDPVRWYKMLRLFFAPAQRLRPPFV